jgi:branched-chain amino acid transport system ATP-binding protein
MKDAVLSVRDLSVSFGSLRAVNALSLEAHKGRITSVIGPNGAGKSTLFNVVSGAIAPSAGRVLFEGRDITGLPTHRIVAAGLARSFQITNLFFELTVLDNLRLACQMLESPAKTLLPFAKSRRARARADEMLERFGLQAKAAELAGYLSHGEQRRLEIALALAGAPKLLLLDEPTQGMSHADTAETSRMIRALAGELSILLIEHDIGVVMDLSDHVVVMHQGAKLAEGTPQAVRANPAVQEAYFGHA